MSVITSLATNPIEYANARGSREFPLSSNSPKNFNFYNQEKVRIHHQQEEELRELERL
jgi:hypothetical protein